MLLPNFVPFLYRLPTLVHPCLLLVKVFFMKFHSAGVCIYGAPKLAAVRAVPHAQLKDRNREMLTTDGNPLEREREGISTPHPQIQEIGRSSSPPKSWHNLQILMIICALAMLPPNRITTGPSRLEHSMPHWLEHVLRAVTQTQFKGLSLKSFRTRTTRAGGEWAYLPSGTRTHLIKWDAIRDKSKSTDLIMYCFVP